MEVRSRLRDIAQARNLEDVKIRIVLRDVGAAFIRSRDARLLPIVADDAEFLEGIASDASAIVTAGAAEIDELAQARLFVFRQRLDVAGEEYVEFRRRQQRAFERRRRRRPNSSN